MAEDKVIEIRNDGFSVDFGDMFGDDDDELPVGDADGHEFGFRATSQKYDDLDVDLSPWPPLLGMLDSTEPEVSPDDRPFTPSEGVEGAHALELRAESMLQYAERGAERTGELDRTEVGVSDDNRDVVAGRDDVEIDGMLEEHTGHGLVHVADDVEVNVGGRLRMHAHLEDNIVMAGVMRDEFAGGTFITAAMSDDMAAGLGLRCTAPLDVWAHGLMGMEERPGTCAADGILLELAGTLYEREYGPSAHAALVARHSGTVVTTMKTGFRPLMKTALGVRNLIPGGGGGGGAASASPPTAPPAPGGGETAGAVTLTAAEGGGALGRGVAGSDDTDEIVSVVRTMESASDADDVENLQHPASTADNLDDLARVDAEAAGYRQVAEIYEQPVPASAASEPHGDELSALVAQGDSLQDSSDLGGAGVHQLADSDNPPPLAPEQPAADPSPGSGRAAPGSQFREPPPLDLTEPGTEGYDFGKSYGSLRERNRLYRLDSNWRGNFVMRDYLGEIEAKAIELLTKFGGSVDDVPVDNFGRRASGIYDALATMAEEAEIAGDASRVDGINSAIGELEGFVQGTLVEVAARTDEFSGTVLGSQRVPIDSSIDSDRVRSWLQDQLLKTQEKFIEAENIVDPEAKGQAVQLASWEAAYWDQMLKTLDAGVNPLADSGEQITLIRVEKVEPYYAPFKDQIAAAAAEGFDLVVPRPKDEDQLDLFLELQDRLVATISDPEYFRSAEEMGADTFTPFVRARIEAGGDFLGPDSLRPLAGGVDEPDAALILGADAPPPPPPEHPVTDPPPGADPAAPGSAAREPSPLDLTEPGTEGYDFWHSYGSLHDRNQFYREEFNFRGNFFMREYLREIDTQALELFTDLGGPVDEITDDNFGYRTSSIYRTLEQMAEEADAAGEVDRAADSRTAMRKIEGIVNSTLAEAAARTDEFSGAALGSQRAPIDRNIDTVKLRSWLQEQSLKAQEKFSAAANDEAAQLATWEWGYYVQLIKSLDEDVNPLAVSNEQIAVIRINKVDPYYAPFKAEIDAAAAEGYVLVIPRPQAEDEVDLYVKLQELLATTLSDPEFFRSADEMGAGAFTATVRSRIEARLDVLGPDSRRPLLAGGDIPPPLPAADFADGAGYVDEVRDRSFSRSPLAASEETLQRQVASLAEGDAAVRSRTPVSGSEGSGIPERSLGRRRAPSDNAQAPVIDERSGRWVVEPPAESGGSPSPAHGASTSVHGDGASRQASGVSWESGLQLSSEPEVGPAAGNAGDADTSDLFKTASEPEDVGPEGVDEVQHARDANDDGVFSSPGTGSDGTGGEDANPTGTVSGPDDFTTAPGRGDWTGPGRSGTTSRITSGTPEPVSTGATPAGASAADADAGAAGTRSVLYDEPVSFEGRSLEGAPRSDDPKELAQSLDGAEIPVEDLPPVEPGAAEPARKSILRNSDGRPVSDSYRDVHDQVVQLRLEWAEDNRNWLNRGTDTADSAWSGGRNRKAAVREANARWSEFAAAQRTSPISFSDDPRQLLYPTEHEASVYSRSRGRFVELYHGADPPNTIDRAHAAHYIPRPRGWEPTHETGFGRLSHGWNEFPFSPREQIVNALSKGESLNPEQIAALESGLEGHRAAGGDLSSSQYRAMTQMISDLGDQYQHARWHMHGTPDTRLLQLIEMLDYAVVVV